MLIIPDWKTRWEETVVNETYVNRVVAAFFNWLFG